MFFETLPIFLLTLFITDHMRYILVVILFCVLQSCCSSRVSSYTAKSDTCFITQHHVDSTYLHDSISFNTYRDSDTIFKVITNHRNYYHYRNIVDTVYKVRVDTIYTQISHTPRSMSSTSSVTSTLFFIILLIIILSIVLTKWIGTK